MKIRSFTIFTIIFSLLLATIPADSDQKDTPTGKDESLRKGERRQTLDPGLFKNPEVKKAYQVAKEIPWVLDSIYCFCQCDDYLQHKSLLSCYVDDHAVG